MASTSDPIPAADQAMNATPAVLWRGWFRANKSCRWTCLVPNAKSYDESWMRLLDALASLQGGESLVTTTDPNNTPPAYHRRHK